MFLRRITQQFVTKRPYHQQHAALHRQDASLSPSQPLLIAVGGYFALINAAAVGLFWYDKNQALKGGWRVPEKQLQLTALLGGWVGGMWAMKTFRHKTVKKSFQEPYMAAVGVNCVAVMGLVAGWGLLPGLRKQANAYVRRLMP